MPEFLHVKTVEEVFHILSQFEPVGMEVLPISKTLGRVAASPVAAPEAVPHFARATMDGFAVKARDTFGASEALPALLQLDGEILMGHPPGKVLGGGSAMAIPTGGMLPEGADAVVMVEYTQPLDDRTIEVTRPVAPGDNILGVGEDIAPGAPLLAGGWTLRPQDLGILAALGIEKAEVFKRPRVAVISTGDEIVSMAVPSVPPAKVRDINTFSLSALVEEAGGIVGIAKVLKDDLETMVQECQALLQDHDVLLFSGGSSVGARDYTLRVLDRLPGVELLVSGVAIRPGKPTILARMGKKAVWGLPGQPVSAMMICRIFVMPLLKIMQGCRRGQRVIEDRSVIRAVLGRQVPSVHGRADCIPVALTREEDGGYTAQPVFGKSAMISILVKADGYVLIPEHDEGLEQGSSVTVHLFSPL